jgi:hypothetical protein
MGCLPDGKQAGEMIVISGIWGWGSVILIIEHQF